mmetsp:Transcript_17725/g.30100  ORF Transcript_17725/g.30100 Transcript_17725/m.30100 type:complete len:93 (-) Transcript_17725:181-459(-)
MAPVTAMPTRVPTPGPTPIPTNAPRTCPTPQAPQYWQLEGMGKNPVVPCLNNAMCADFQPKDADRACCHFPMCICGAYIPDPSPFAISCTLD